MRSRCNPTLLALLPLVSLLWSSPVWGQTCTTVFERGGYQFEEPNATDPAEGGGYPLTPSGTEVAIGRVGSSRRLDGVDDSLTYVHSFCGPGCFGPPVGQAELWVQPDSDGVVVAMDDAFATEVVKLEIVGSAPRLHFDDGVSTHVLNGPVIASGDWAHIGYELGATTRLYVDGVEVDTAATLSSGPVNADVLVLGSDSGGAGFFAGRIDEFQLHGSLSVAEAAAIHTAGGGGKCPPAPAWEIIGSHGTAFDVAITAKDGTGTEYIYSFGNAFERFDGTTSTGIAVPDGGLRAKLLGALGADGRIYIVGGDDLFQPNSTDDFFEIYDPVTDTWLSSEATVPDHDPFPVPISDGAAVAISHGGEDFIYVFGGAETSGGLGTSSGPFNLLTYRYNITNPTNPLWQAPGAAFDPPVAMVGIDAAVDDEGQAYATNGSFMRRFDPDAGTKWTTLNSAASLHVYGGFAVANDGKMYVINGNFLCPTNTVEVFDPDSGVEDWVAPAPSTSDAWFGVSAASLGDKLYAFGGITHGSCGVNQNPARALGGFPYCPVSDMGVCSEACAHRWRGEDGNGYAFDSHWNPHAIPTTEKALLENAAVTGNESVVVMNDSLAACGARVEGTGSGLQTLALEGTPGTEGTLTTTNGTEVNANGVIQLDGGRLLGPVDVGAGGLLTGIGQVGALSSSGLVQAGSGDDIEVVAGFTNEVGGLVTVTLGTLETANDLVNDRVGASVGEIELTAGTLVVPDPAACTDPDTGLLNFGTTTVMAGSSVIDGGVSNFGTFLAKTGSITTQAGRLVNRAGGVVNLEPASIWSNTSGCPYVDEGLTNDYGVICITPPCPSGPSTPPQMSSVGGFELRQGSAMLLGTTEVTSVGSWDIAIDDPTGFDLGATVSVVALAGGASVEMLSGNLGSSANLPNAGNFSIPHLKLTSGGGTVSLVDAHDNTAGASAETAYVEFLELVPGLTLDLAGATMYYETVSPPNPTGGGSGVTVIDSVGGGALVQLLPAIVACGDGGDNDGDLLTDFPADPGCYSVEDPDEGTRHCLFQGAAAGGVVTAVVSGYRVTITTSAGETAADVAANLAAAINGHASLATLGVTATAVGSDVETNGTYGDLDIDDAGLSEGQGHIPQVPALPLSAWALLALGVVVSGMRTLRGRASR